MAGRNKGHVDAFAEQLKRFGKVEVPNACSALQRKIALQALQGLVLKTPVDTGRARANWQVTLDEPAGGTLEATDPSGGGTIAGGAATIGAVEPYGSIWITNNLPYIEELEDGHSDQAPNGMLAVTLAELRSIFGR